MNTESIKRYVGKKVLIILKNNFKFTTIIPNFDGDVFEITDKYGQKALIDCDMVSMVYEKNGSDMNE